jgi:pyridoxamine 5'-phosphate oxidase
MPLAARWLQEAIAGEVQPNPNAMTLATAAESGQPSARVVLVKDLNTEQGYLVFYSHYDSRKGLELAANPRAAAVFHWDLLGRQLRLEGQVVRSPASESDAYFATRPRLSQLYAWASDQSQPIADRSALLAQAEARAARLGISVTNNQSPRDDDDKPIRRPHHWGGFRLWIGALEFWVHGDGRFHDRIRYQRELPAPGPTAVGPWSAMHLQP